MLNAEELDKRYNAIKAEASQVDIEDRAKFIKDKLDKEFSLDEIKFIAEHCIRHI